MSAKSSPVGELLELHHAVKERKFGIVVAEWNAAITEKLLSGCREYLLMHNIPSENIIVKHVPGSFELPLAGQFLAEYAGVDAVICIGCLIKGETPHFEYISSAVSHEIMKLGTKYNIPFTFGVITVNTIEQAYDRTGGKWGNKGEEAALAALKLLSIKEELKP
jgi:6,7-dimethyl-8-ribityllumazine synthase